jgi:hypothetical protein
MAFRGFNQTTLQFLLQGSTEDGLVLKVGRKVVARAAVVNRNLRGRKKYVGKKKPTGKSDRPS